MTIKTPVKPSREDKYLTVDNSALYQELRSSIVSSDAWLTDSCWPTADLTSNSKSVKATARIGPKPGIESSLTDLGLNEWRVRVADYMLRMDDLNADILDATVAIWLERCGSPDTMTIIKAEDYFHYRGLQPRGHSFWTDQKREIAARIMMLSDTWINLHESSTHAVGQHGKQVKSHRLKSRVLVVSSMAEQESFDGSAEYAWRVRPGDVFMPMLLSKSGKQLALLSQKVLSYNYWKYSHEKRCARYFAWLARIRQGRGAYLSGIRIRSILQAIRKPIDPVNPMRSKDRLERALDKLAEDGVIRCWQYQDFNEAEIGRKGWVPAWLDHCVVVEPPQAVLDQYERIASPKTFMRGQRSRIATDSMALISILKAHRQSAGLTQLQAAERLGISPNYYAMLERGVRDPSPALWKTITGWIHS